MKNKYPVYIISKGRYNNCLTAKFFIKDGIDFKLVVEPQEYDEYYKKFSDKVVKLPFNNLGLGSYPARNWCWEDSISRGFERHWIFDDNIREVERLYKSIRITSNSKYALRFIEDITDNYTNIGISGMNYTAFVTGKTNKPFVVNYHIYSNLLIKNDLPFRWRLRYNEDTDLCLQILNYGLCTLYTNVFMISKMRTMTMKGGNSDELYKGQGRLKMARMLEAVWPEYIKTKWRFGRPQHVVSWGKFKHGLILIKDPKKIDLKDYGELKIINEPKSKKLKELLCQK